MKNKKQVPSLRVPEVSDAQAEGVKGAAGGVPGAPSIQAGGIPGGPTIGAGGIPGTPTIGAGGIPGRPLDRFGAGGIPG